jgi:hypothetical protein
MGVRMKGRFGGAVGAGDDKSVMAGFLSKRRR